MALKIVRNDITKMNTEAIVNTANDKPTVGTGCDYAVYEAAGYDELLTYREEKIGVVEEGKCFITPGFHLQAKYIIHAVSPYYVDGKHGEEEQLRSCYRESLKLAKEYGIKSISIPLISTGGFGYPKEEGFRIAVDEINAFLLSEDMLVYLVVFDPDSVELGEKISADLEHYIDQHYVSDKWEEEYPKAYYREPQLLRTANVPETNLVKEDADYAASEDDYDDMILKWESDISERMEHRSDTFSEYLLYLIESKGMTNVEVWRNACLNKKIFSKIKNHPEYHPTKLTALALCIGAKLNMDETIDLLARAGYALSPCDKTDIIFSYFIEKEIYAMSEIDIQLEAHGLPYLIKLP